MALPTKLNRNRLARGSRAPVVDVESAADVPKAAKRPGIVLKLVMLIAPLILKVSPKETSMNRRKVLQAIAAGPLALLVPMPASANLLTAGHDVSLKCLGNVG